MKQIKTDCAIIGGGPAGLAAAVEAHKAGLDTLIIERDLSLGGILQQCIHDGFGLLRFKRRMTGGQYAQAFIDEVEASGIGVKLDTMVLEIRPDKTIYAVNEKDGLLEIKAGSIILAMGCRERTRSQVMIYGTRPAGVLTAGAVQRYINMEGYLPGKKAVILGSGDIGLIMARRMTLEDIEVKGVYEIMHTEGGLTRNIVQCLEDYDIPLHLGTTVTEIHGRDRIEGVTVAKVDENLKPIEGTEEYIDCDLLVLSVGLIPENELSEQLDIEMDPRTRGPVVDEQMMTSVPGIFAAGNVVTVFDLVDYVSQTGEMAARGAVRYLKGELETGSCRAVEAGDNISFVVPQKISGTSGEVPVFMRVRKPDEKVRLVFSQDGQSQKLKKHAVVKPPEMVCEVIDLGKTTDGPICISLAKE
ncbi:Thioredoxin reductase [Eubacterium maltosivorans]|uniref:NAD(P)/FAD-dependent oxidoreductase n=1 Tax=Eubacterium maltosivorans TaxID=2041044 RepID=UPI00088222DF|nr:FAD-dependent oxidoreductase [Eubacterium maltosivorans]WPK80624.1 Ferredoxin--NADP reductase [Eubacterium maltosivorans]SDO24456.1 Thioredoxin reductase [Eubacterium maltosivorans]